MAEAEKQTIAPAAEINTRVLLVESDETLVKEMSTDLAEAGYLPFVATDASSALAKAFDIKPALIAIDRSLGGESGLKLCVQMRVAGFRVPVLLLFTRDGLEDRIACLQAGADDYFLKPYRAQNFLQLLRLYLKPETTTNEQLRFGSLVLDLTTRRATRNGRTIDLTMKEYELLKYLMSHPREVLTREQILENVWGYDFRGASNVIEVYIRYLRLKIEDEGERRLIQTVRGVGYVLREP